MNPPPIALGLTLCDHVIVEKGTNKISLIGTFTRMRFDRFPTEPRSFWVHAALTNGLGDATADLILAHPDTDEELFVQRTPIRFGDKLSEVQLLFRVERVFPVPGRYLFNLLIDREWVAQRHFRIFAAEDGT